MFSDYLEREFLEFVGILTDSFQAWIVVGGCERIL